MGSVEKFAELVKDKDNDRNKLLNMVLNNEISKDQLKEMLR